MPGAWTIRRATLDELPIIIHHRWSMFTEMGAGTVESRAAMNAPSTEWIGAKMAAGDYLGWFAVAPSGEVVAGLGLYHMDWVPGPLDITLKRAYILNVYTESAWRGQGIAKALLRTALDWSREHGLQTAILHASDAGRPLYESLGFTASTEMRMALEPATEN